MTEWWRRAQWVLNATASTNDTMYPYGIRILGVLAKSDLAGSGFVGECSDGTSTISPDSLMAGVAGLRLLEARRAVMLISP